MTAFARTPALPEATRVGALSALSGHLPRRRQNIVKGELRSSEADAKGGGNADTAAILTQPPIAGSTQAAIGKEGEIFESPHP